MLLLAANPNPKVRESHRHHIRAARNASQLQALHISLLSDSVGLWMNTVALINDPLLAIFALKSLSEPGNGSTRAPTNQLT